jgi:hypothetical protein
VLFARLRMEHLSSRHASYVQVIPEGAGSVNPVFE